MLHANQHLTSDADGSSDHAAWLVHCIIRAISHLRVVVFGLRAREDARPDSDLDLLIDIGDDRDPRLCARQVREMLADRRIGLGCLVVPPAVSTP